MAKRTAATRTGYDDGHLARRCRLAGHQLRRITCAGRLPAWGLRRIAARGDVRRVYHAPRLVGPGGEGRLVKMRLAPAGLPRASQLWDLLLEAMGAGPSGHGAIAEDLHPAAPEVADQDVEGVGPWVDHEPVERVDDRPGLAADNLPAEV